MMPKTDRQSRKQNGVHYTPTRLAEFLADQIVRQLAPVQTRLRILDPACGDGRLLSALATRLPGHLQLTLTGYETQASESRQARQNLETFDNCSIEIRNADFLQSIVNDSRQLEKFDIVISNPPYVRTQTLGQPQAQRLAQQFGLTGRVDLSYAFSMAIELVLNNHGILGLLTSNRFMYVQSGTPIRSRFQNHFQLCSVLDLGDTKLFKAAVLPMVLIAIRSTNPAGQNQGCPFTRIHQSSCGLAANQVHSVDELLDALTGPSLPAAVKFDGQTFGIQHGVLEFGESPREPWRLETPASKKWFATVTKKQTCRFSDVAEIKVGIKSTADRVFIRDDWHQLPARLRPEADLLHPLVTHRETDRWALAIPQHLVLYPYDLRSEKKTIVDLEDFPNARRYLEEHRKQLESRGYVIQAGRRWYEIWVPQQPHQWQYPKVVWPDISERPRFCLDTSGAIVNGDCYWIKLRSQVDPDWMYLILAVANSSIAMEMYDYRFHNKLYSGRRRFMTQYVKEFPLPDLDAAVAQEIVRATKAITRENVSDRAASSRTIDALVGTAFGF